MQRELIEFNKKTKVENIKITDKKLKSKEENNKFKDQLDNAVKKIVALEKMNTILTAKYYSTSEELQRLKETTQNHETKKGKFGERDSVLLNRKCSVPTKSKLSPITEVKF